jgi:hypothetical protein
MSWPLVGQQGFEAFVVNKHPCTDRSTPPLLRSMEDAMGERLSWHTSIGSSREFVGVGLLASPLLRNGRSRVRTPLAPKNFFVARVVGSIIIGGRNRIDRIESTETMETNSVECLCSLSDFCVCHYFSFFD